MKSIIRPLGISLALGCAATAAFAQTAGPKIDRVDIKFVGPSSIGEDFIRSNLKLKPGATFMPGQTQDDVHSLYGTGQFYNIRVAVDNADNGGVVITYTVQARPRVTEIKFEGNKKLSDNKLKKKVTVKVGDPLDEQKLFTNVQEMKKLYENNGLSETKVKYVLNIEETTGHGVVVFHVEESPKVKIADVEFPGAKNFKAKQLRKEIKTKQRWMFSWITGSGYFKQDDFDGDRDRLSDFYHNHGYLDFQVNDVKLEQPKPGKLDVKFFVNEGQQYKVGSVKFTGSKIFSDSEIVQGLQDTFKFQSLKGKLGASGLPMDAGDVFTPDGLSKDNDLVQDFYGSKGYIEINQGQALHTLRVPNLEKGTMDLEFQMDETQKSHVQKVEIRGNLKTKDKVIRRELAIAPGDVMDMVRVKISRQRLDGLQYFSKVEANPEPTDPPIADQKNLIINVEEQNTGNFTVGAGFSSVDALVGYAEVSQGNFDLFHPPYFTGGGQKLRVRLQLGTKRQDYELSFIEPWFLNRKLALGVDLYRHVLNYESPNNIFNENRTGGRLSLTRALGSDYLIGSVNYTVEQIGITLNDGWHGEQPWVTDPGGAEPNVPNAILNDVGENLYQRLGGSIAYDTRNSTRQPNRGQRTELTGEFNFGNKSFYKLELHTAWYFPGLLKGHIIEAGGRAGFADSISGEGVPFYERYYLGGLYSMRGFKYRNISPRELRAVPDANGNPYFDEPIGGNSYWFGSVEYSIPILEKDTGPSLRVALFYDIGAVSAGSYSFDGSYLDNWGLGLRLNIPRLGPLRLDYGIPISRDEFNSGGGKFQFGVGYTRDF